VAVEPLDTIKLVKAKIKGISPDQQILIDDSGQTMEDEQTVFDCRLKEGCVLQLVLRMQSS